MHSPKISVIVPVCNAGEYLGRCIDSILYQTEPDLELILINDGSTDGSGALCDRYAAGDQRVRVIHKRNQGVSRARNDGLRAARGKWIAFADGDDWLEPDMYQRLLAAGEETGCDAVYCGFRRVWADRAEVEAFPERRVLAGDRVKCFVEDLLKAKAFGAVWRCVLARETVGECRFDEDIVYAEDLLFQLEVLKNVTALAQIPDALYNYNKASENSISNRTERNPDLRYTRSLQRQLKANEYWRIPLDYQEFFRVYVDMMFQYLVRLLEEDGTEDQVERYLSEGFFSQYCHYDRKIPLRRRIVCILIRRRHFRLAVAVRKAEDAVLRLLGR